MYARVVTNQPQAGKTKQWLALIRDSVVPSLRAQEGFAGFVALVNRQHDKSIGYSVWADENGLAASETSGNYQQQIANLGAVLAGPPAREVYELTVVA